jgi:hypothetical protein
MRFGLELVSHVYDAQRVELATRSFNSLAKTNILGLDKPVLQLTYKPASFNYDPFVEKLKEKFEVNVLMDPLGMPSGMANFCPVCEDGVMKILDQHQDVTHVDFLWDDFVYNPEWLQELAKLIERHPVDTMAWSVYRSAYTAYHRIIGGDGVDVLMTMHDGIGCMTREEFGAYMASGWAPCPDIDHASRRPGNRWATSRDYKQNIGKSPSHAHFAEYDCAIDFVGEE